MPSKTRAEFKELTKRQLSERVAYMCSNPYCRRLTVKRRAAGRGVVRLGKACHIFPAAPGGPRANEKVSDQELSAPENGIWLCDEHANEVDSNQTKYPADLLRRWKDEAEAYVETLTTQDTRLRQLRMMATEFLSTVRLITAVPGPGKALDQTFRTAGHIPVSRLLIEVEQTLFENDFRDEADLVRRIGQDIRRVEGLMATNPYDTYLDISAWKNRSVKELMLNLMKFSEESFTRYEAVEQAMVTAKLKRLQGSRIVTCSDELVLPARLAVPA